MLKQPEVVLTLRRAAFLNKCRRTVKQARAMVAPSSMTRRQWVRTHALRGIRRPIFILGCPRSGTTFLGQILEALPSATYYYEPPILKYYARLVHQGVVSARQSRRFYTLMCRSLLFLCPGNGPRMIEKNPVHTWIAKELYSVFPDARFVIITRDGRDVAASLAEKPWHRSDALDWRKREPGGYLYGPFPHFYIEPSRAEEFAQTSDLHRCIWIWRRFAEETERLKSILPSAAQFHLSYEELIGQPERTVDSLLSFLEETDADSRERVLQQAMKGHRASIGRWKDRLDNGELLMIESEAGEMMRRAGYVDDYLAIDEVESLEAPERVSGVSTCDSGLGECSVSPMIDAEQA